MKLLWGFCKDVCLLLVGKHLEKEWSGPIIWVHCTLRHFQTGKRIMRSHIPTSSEQKFHLLHILPDPLWSPTYLLLYATHDEWFSCPWSGSQSLLRAKSKSKAALQMISNSLLLFQSPGGLKSGSPLWDLPETAGHPYLPQIPLAHRVWHILIHVAGLLGAQPTAAADSSLTMEAIQNLQCMESSGQKVGFPKMHSLQNL